MKRCCPRLHFLLSVIVLLAPTVNAQSSQTASEVMTVEAARTTALDRSDVPQLERIMANDVTYIHASGKVDTKKSYLAAIRSGQLHYISWKPRNLQVRIIGDAAVIKGEYEVRVRDSRVQTTPFDINIFILTEYGHRDSRWQQIAWQSTRDVRFRP